MKDKLQIVLGLAAAYCGTVLVRQLVIACWVLLPFLTYAGIRTYEMSPWLSLIISLLVSAVLLYLLHVLLPQPKTGRQAPMTPNPITFDFAVEYEQPPGAAGPTNSHEAPDVSAHIPSHNASPPILGNLHQGEELRARIRAEIADLHSYSVKEGYGLPGNRDLADRLAAKLWGSGFVESERLQRLYFYETAAAEILALHQKLADAPTQEMAQDATVEETRKQWRKQLECRQGLDDTLLRPYVLLRDVGRSPDEIAELLSIPGDKVETMLKQAIYKVEMAA
jgi:hypothetical protein